jgi:O-antigen/teichoic acid export membrane protein
VKDTPQPWRRLRLDQPSPAGVSTRALLSTVGIGVQGVVRFLFSLLIGRSSGPAVLGEASAPVSLALFASLLWPTATGTAAAKFVAIARGAQRPEDIAGVAAHLARRTVLSGLVLGVCSAVVALTVLHTGLAAAGMTGLLAIAYSGYAFTRGLQFGAGQVPRATFWDVGTAALSLVALVLVVSSHSVPVLLLPLVVGYAVYSVANWPRPTGLRPAVDLRREMDGFVLLGVVGTLASTGFLQISNVLARAANSPHDAGLYAAALSLATPASLLSRSVSLVLFPSMSEAHGREDRASLRAQTDLGTRALVLVMVGTFGVIVILSRAILQLAYRDDFSGAGTVLPIMLIAVLLGTVVVAGVNYLTSTSQQGMRISAGTSVIGLLIGCASWGLLVPAYGVAGVAVGYLIGSVFITLPILILVWRRERHHWTALAVRFIVAVAVLVLLAVYEQHADIGTLPAFGLAAAFLVAWLAISATDVRRVLPLIVSRNSGAQNGGSP